MVLFIDIESVLVPQCFQNKNNIFKNIIFDEKILTWIKNQNFEKIYLVTNQKGISQGWIDEKLFDLEFGYVIKFLELFTKISVFGEYYPYENPNGYLIKGIIEREKIDKNNAILLGNRKNHKKDADISGLKYIDSKGLNYENIHYS